MCKHFRNFISTEFITRERERESTKTGTTEIAASCSLNEKMAKKIKKKTKCDKSNKSETHSQTNETE